MPDFFISKMVDNSSDLMVCENFIRMGSKDISGVIVGASSFVLTNSLLSDISEKRDSLFEYTIPALCMLAGVSIYLGGRYLANHIRNIRHQRYSENNHIFI